MKDLDSIPRLRLAHLPTPLDAMPTLSKEMGGPLLFMKRDDCTGFAGGGNKGRKLEFTLAHARDQGADSIITFGGLQSNWVRQTAAACAKLGMDFHGVISSPLSDPSPSYASSGNLLLDKVFGATLYHVDDDQDLIDKKISDITDLLRKAGKTPYVAPLGASDRIGSLGYVAAAFEFLDQCEAMSIRPSHIVTSTGSAGTHAGLLAGLRLRASDISVVGVSSSEPSAVKQVKVFNIAAEVLDDLGEGEKAPEFEEITVFDDYVGAGYGHPTPEANAAILLTAQKEGVLLDPVYTGKAMAGMLDLIRKGYFSDAREIVFLHTGGSPALFGYAEQFA